ncbi:putative dnaA [Mycobacterium ulcerans str. Harvey]|uniref:DnaA n=1 Tax=Mycobacterium ulcerans str. Harvey TaxID=1299332 RepID=A0ABN0R8T2_MYCUL|nr:putative dnaA [Mycobacterium ulcerans str. Harvey]
MQNEIERHLRTPITAALSRRLGQQIQLGVRIARRPPTMMTIRWPPRSRTRPRSVTRNVTRSLRRDR